MLPSLWPLVVKVKTMLNTKELLTKLGTAIYIHKALIKQAQKGKEAVDYLKKCGMLKDRVVRRKHNG